MLKLRLPFLLTLVTLVAASVVAAAAQATAPGANGRIVFRRYLDAQKTWGALLTIQPDGTYTRQLTRPPKGVVDDQPDWAPDGSRITFTRCPDGGTCHLWTVNSDGTGLAPVGPLCPVGGNEEMCPDDAAGSFTPDSKQITFTQATGKVKPDGAGGMEIEHSAIAIIGADGSGRRVIYQAPPYAADLNSPMLSPDGKQVVFEWAVSALAKPQGRTAVFVVGSDGTGLRRLTPWNEYSGDNPDWSPDGKWILFHSHLDDPAHQAQFFLIRPDGTGRRQISHFPNNTHVGSASFSPDGKSITFAKGVEGGNIDVYTMRLDGTHVRRLTRSPLWESAPDWGPSTPSAVRSPAISTSIDTPAAPLARSAGPVAVAPAHVGPPSSIVVLGHSIPAAWNSDFARPGVDTKQNSWATGSNQAVKSVYSRILALNPRIRGRNTNLAHDGADVNAVEQQAVRAANLRGSLKPEMVVIQVMDNDIRCDGSDPSNYALFRRTLTRVFDTLAKSVPDARIFLISQLGTSDTLADAIQTTAASRAAFSGHGPCDFFDPGGSRNEAHVKYMDSVISGYEQQLVAVCRAFAHCRYGNMHPYIDTIANLSPDYNHFSVSGQAGIAAVAWSQMFDFTDLTPPVSQITLSRSSQGAVAQLTATDNAGVSGIEYTLTPPGGKAQLPYRTYRSPVRIKKGWTLTWRAVDSNGNSEQTRSIRS